MHVVTQYYVNILSENPREDYMLGSAEMSQEIFLQRQNNHACNNLFSDSSIDMQA